jgi:glycosyltransferase involved in cell wall biosynthesis
MIVGGAQENTLLTCRYQLEAGHDVTLVTGPTTGPEGKLLAMSNIDRLRVVEIPQLIRAVRPFQDLAAWRHLRRHFREAHYDVVHTHSSKAGVLGRIAARQAGTPVVVHTVHGQAFHAYQAAWRNAIYVAAERMAAKYCDKIYAVADAMIDQCVEARVAPRSLYQTVYSGMELESYLHARRDTELRRQLGIPEDALVIGKIARIFELKGYEYLMEAAPKLAATVPNLHFLIVGDGLMRPQIEAEVDALGLRDRFHFSGLVPPSTIPNYVAQMDVLAHLSLREGLPRTVVQALATGKPAVAFSVDGTPEAVINDQTGFVCPPKDATAVTDKLLLVLQDAGLRERLGQQGREFVRERWDWRTMGRILTNDFETLLKEKT